MDMLEQSLLNNDEKPGRVWEFHPDDTTPFSANYHPILVTTDKSDQDTLAAYIHNWIRTSPVGYDEGAPQRDPLDPENNTIGSVRHCYPPNTAIYYSFTEQNCVWLLSAAVPS
jgi:hypothetical protein